MTTWAQFNNNVGANTKAVDTSPSPGWDAFNQRFAPVAYKQEAGSQSDIDPALYQQLRSHGVSSGAISNNLNPEKVTKSDIALDVLNKADKASTKFLSALATPFQVLSGAIQGIEKGIGAESQYAAQKVTGMGDKSISELYSQSPTAGGMIADTLDDITKWARGKTNKTPTTLDYFFPEFIGQLADAGVETAILAPIGARIATEYKTVKVTPDQMVDVMTGRTPVGEPLPPETANLVKSELLKPETAKTVIKEAVQKGVEFNIKKPANAVRQIAGEFIGGSPEEAKTTMTIGGKTVEPTTPFQALSKTAPQLPSTVNDFTPLIEEARTPFQEIKKRTEVQQSLAKAISDGSSEPVYFGEITQKKLQQINNIRRESGQPILESRSLFVYPNVVSKLQAKRVAVDGLTPDQVADIAFSAVHNTKSKVLSTNYPHIQKIIKAGENISNLAFIGRTDEGVSSIKSTYPEKTARNKKTLDGRASPSSNYTSTEMEQGARQAARLSAVQGSSNNIRLPNEVKSVNAPLELAKSGAQNHPLEPIGTGNTRVSRLAASVEEKAVEAKLTKGFDELPGYQQVNLKEQAQKSISLLSSEPEKAIRIALGKEVPPADVLPESVFTAVEEHAIKQGDVELLRQLASSNLTSEATAMGQRIRALAERNPESPVSIMQDVVKKREAVAKKKLKGKSINETKKKTVESIVKEIKRFTPREKDWSSFIEKIKCNY